MTTLKIIFAGTPEFAVPTLQALIDSPHEICAVYTQPDRPAGRGRKVTASPIKLLAIKHQLPVVQPQSLRDEATQETLRHFNADIMVVAAYGLILPQAVLAMPVLGCINVHASLLPRWRGAAPIQHAILAGDEQTGITIMQMDAGLDTGPMLSKAACTIEKDDTSQSLHDKLAQLGATELIKTLELLEQNNIQPIVQDETQATHAAKITKNEAAINWRKSAPEIEREVRAFNPWPVAYTQIDDQTIRIWQAQVIQAQTQAKPGTIINTDPESIDVATGSGALRIVQLQFPGSRVMNVKDALNARQALFKGSFKFNKP